MGKGRLSLGTMKMLIFLKRIFSHRYVALLLRLYIGGLFIYASMYKINYAAEFSETIANYQIIPYWAVNFVAVVHPRIELICGILLVIGIRARSAAMTIIFLMILFSIAITVSLVNNAPISCGCFYTVGDQISLWTLLRDLIWMLMTLHVFFYDKAFQLEKRFSVDLKGI